MYTLQKRTLQLSHIPSSLVPDFEAIVLDAYFKAHYYDLIQVTSHVDIFSLFVYSLEEYGDPYYTERHSCLTNEKELTIMNDGFSLIMEDVFELLHFHQIFFTIDDLYSGDDRHITQALCYNRPFLEVW